MIFGPQRQPTRHGTPTRPTSWSMVGAGFALALVFLPAQTGLAFAQSSDADTEVDAAEDQLECTPFDELEEDADAIFLGVVEAIDDPIVDYRLTDREKGEISNRGDLDQGVTVFYSDNAPAALIGDELRVRVSFSNGVATSNVLCLGTTTPDDEPLDAATDALGAIGRSAGEVADRVGRLLLLGSAIVIGATVVLTLVRRMFPKLL